VLLTFKMAGALVKFLNPSFLLSAPTDVRFVFSEHGGAVKEVTAHTQILACSSEVFYRQFFGAFTAEKEIEIKDTSADVFQAMIEFIYNKKPKCDDLELSFLISLYYQADKYDIQDLCNDITVSIHERLVTKEHILAVAILAEEHILHPPLSDALWDAATNFWKEEGSWKTKLDYVQDLYTDENEEYGMIVFKLMNRARKRKCKICQQTPCLDGQKLSSSNFNPGAKVVSYTNSKVRILIKSVGGRYFCAKKEEDEIVRDDFIFNVGYFYKCK